MFDLANYRSVELGHTGLSDRAADDSQFTPQAGANPTLQNVNDFYNREIRYKADFPRDHWQDAAETWDLKTGDCEDYAMIKARELLEQGLADWSSMAIFRGTFCYPSTSDLQPIAHAMLVVRHDGELQGLDNNYVVVRPFSWWLTEAGSEPQVFDPHDAVTPENSWFYSKAAGPSA